MEDEMQPEDTESGNARFSIAGQSPRFPVVTRAELLVLDGRQPEE